MDRVCIFHAHEYVFLYCLFVAVPFLTHALLKYKKFSLFYWKKTIRPLYLLTCWGDSSSGEIRLFRAVILSKSIVLVHFLKNALVHLWFHVCIRDKYKNKRQKQNIKHILAILHLLEDKILKDHSNKVSNTTNLSFRILIILFIWSIKAINYNVCCL